MRRLVLAVMVGRVATAHADTASVDVTLTPAGQMLAQALGYSPDTLISKVQDNITNYYQTARIGAVLRTFVDATSFVNRDVGVDYAIHSGDIVFGVVADGALESLDTGAPSTDSTSGHVIAGEAINVGVMAGANLGRWGLPRWSVYANGFYEPVSLESLAGHLASGAVHVQLRAIAPAPSSATVQWIGLDVGSGLELTRWTLGAAEPIKTTFTVHGDPSGARNLTLISTGTLSLVADAVTVPIEASTGVRLGPLAVFAGVGTDVTVGSSTLAATLDGDMAITSDGTNVGHVAITASGSNTPTPFAVRALGGLQLDVPYVSIFLQGNATTSATALSFGLRGRL